MEQVIRSEATDPFCLDQADAVALLAGAPWTRYAVVGDSLSLGTGDPTPGYGTQGWPDRVAAVLRAVRPDLAYLNVSEIGATTTRTLEHQLEPLLDFAPDLLHLPCGANDIVRRNPDFGEIERTLRQLYRRARATGAVLTTFTLGSAYVVPVFQDWAQRVVTVNAIVRGLAAEYGAIVIDMHDHPINERADLLSADRIHFSTSGQAVLAAEMVRALAVEIADHAE
ncbi:SGNH/GDSL hydrolase family protein [Nocardia sp. NBC_00511]|uniref:SGNH/GDSL hydrolase family protein n=1 Tax=Nocardia sp. NBC_00511 TaxID=2903591 RepID=UPI0030E1D171